MKTTRLAGVTAGAILFLCCGSAHAIPLRTEIRATVSFLEAASPLPSSLQVGDVVSMSFVYDNQGTVRHQYSGGTVWSWRLEDYSDYAFFDDIDQQAYSANLAPFVEPYSDPARFHTFRDTIMQDKAGETSIDIGRLRFYPLDEFLLDEFVFSLTFGRYGGRGTISLLTPFETLFHITLDDLSVTTSPLVSNQSVPEPAGWLMCGMVFLGLAAALHLCHPIPSAPR